MAQKRGRTEKLELMRTAWNTITWTDEMIDFIKNNYQDMTNAELAKHLGLQLTVVRMKKYELGLRKIILEYWTDEQVEFLKEYYHTFSDNQITIIFNEKFPKNKIWTDNHIAKKRNYLNLKRTPEELKVIHQKHIESGVYREANIKNWEKRGSRKIGESVVWDNKSLTKTENGYIHTRVYVWNQHFGEIPEGKMVCHKDGNPLNCDIDNLILFTREENVIRTRSSLYDGENLETLVLLNRLNKIINNKTRNNGKKQEHGSE